MSESKIEFLGKRPWFAKDGAPRAGYGLLFKVDGKDVIIWVTMEATMNLEGTSEQERAQEAAELFIKMEILNGWNPTVQSALVLNEPAIPGMDTKPP